ncbi:MAG TPA: hypothetical protein VFX86_02290 [Candidatus Saccharimonadales bacterium]|nr:hypothetical protein [Candidatus Saccharimonadales bacterium]
MFLSKLLSIFKRKKDNSKDVSGNPSDPRAVVPPAAAAGAATGIPQPDQTASSPTPTEVAQADAPDPVPSAPDIDIPEADSSFNPSDTAKDSQPGEPPTIPSDDTLNPTSASVDGLSGETGGDLDNDSTSDTPSDSADAPPEAPESPTPETPNPSEDDSQNLTV